jgi:hypothetical protein
MGIEDYVNKLGMPVVIVSIGGSMDIDCLVRGISMVYYLSDFWAD